MLALNIKHLLVLILVEEFAERLQGLGLEAFGQLSVQALRVRTCQIGIHITTGSKPDKVEQVLALSPLFADCRRLLRRKLRSTVARARRLIR